MVYSYRAGIIMPFVHKFKKQLVLVVAAIFIATMAMVGLMANAAPGGNSTAAKASKVDVCHYDEEEDNYHLINISKNAEQKHVDNHGDGYPGENFTDGEPGAFFDENCELFVRSAEITSPVEDAVLPLGEDVSLAAVLIDKDGDDNVQWAVREGTCTAGVGTVAGNVDTFSDPFTWDGASFAATVETDGWNAGDYCFIFNPTESAGDLAIRETREFTLAFQGPIGANVLGYVALACDVTATDDDVLQDVINAATAGDVVCVEDGTYDEFVVDKPLTVAGLSNPNNGSAVVSASAPGVTDLALVSSSDVTITGIKFVGRADANAFQVAGVRITPSAGNADNVHITYNVFSDMASTHASASNKAIQFHVEGGLQALTNSSIVQNVIDGVTSVRGAYGIQTVGDMDSVEIAYNTISNVDGAWGAGVAVDAKVAVTTSNVSVNRNVLETNIWSNVSVQVEHNPDQDGVVVNENNLLGVVHGSGVAASLPEVNAENNWWGDTDPSDQIFGPVVDFMPYAGSAFSTTW